MKVREARKEKEEADAVGSGGSGGARKAVVAPTGSSLDEGTQSALELLEVQYTVLVCTVHHAPCSMHHTPYTNK
jgi:hypothetical protein